MTRPWRPIIALAVAFATGILADHLADGLFGLWAQTRYHAAGNAPTVLGIIAAVGAFWFSWTGRLARLFREVA